MDHRPLSVRVGVSEVKLVILSDPAPPLSPPVTLQTYLITKLNN